MSRITVYDKPTCSTSRRVVALLAQRGVEFDRVEYLTERFDRDALRAILDKAGLRPRDVVRTQEPGARSLDLGDDETTLQALVEDPSLLQRPLVERGERALLARPPERVLELLD